MHALLNHPAIEAGLIPFIVALIVAELFQRMRLSGLAVIAGFAITVYLASNFATTLGGSTHKIIWLGLGSAAVAIALTLLDWSLWRPVLAIVAGAAAVWVGLHLLLKHDVPLAMQWGAGIALYAAWVVYWFDGLRDDGISAGSAGVTLGLGTGGVVLLGASALLGKFALAVGAAAAAYLIIQVITNIRLSCGRTFTLPLSLIAALIGSYAVLASSLPWYILALLGLIPVAAKIPAPQGHALWLQAALLTCFTALFAGAAVYFGSVSPNNLPF